MEAGLICSRAQFCVRQLARRSHGSRQKSKWLALGMLLNRTFSWRSIQKRSALLHDHFAVSG
jgi:hypothetical protein